MTIDSSALVAILFSEPGFLDIVDCILGADTARAAVQQVEGLVRELGITVVPFAGTVA
jgi:uncharacterized protein with PIN domain